MREILFRGKRADNGQWVYGVPVIGITSGVFMVWIESEAKRGRGELSLRDVVKQVEVIPETVGQYTGLDDRNGVKIFEGDVISAWSQGWNAVGEVKHRIDGLWFMYPAYQHKIMWGLCPNHEGKTSVEVIGNIHENPEDK